VSFVAALDDADLHAKTKVAIMHKKIIFFIVLSINFRINTLTKVQLK
jgi:hypothetical protein